MKTVLLALIVLLMTASSLPAEVCVKHHTHTDAFYYGGTTTPEVNRDFELWFGGDKVALVEENTKMIFDLADSTMIFINFPDSIYLLTSLPVQWGNILNEQDAGRVQMYQYTGEMKDLGKEKEIKGHKCQSHMLTTWIPYEDIKYNETDDVTWYTEDMPFDMTLYGKAYPCFMALRNYNAELLASIGDGHGYPMRSESTRFQKGLEIKTVTTVEDIVEKDAPEGFWGVPEGYTQKDRLTLQELQGN